MTDQQPEVEKQAHTELDVSSSCPSTLVTLETPEFPGAQRTCNLCNHKHLGIEYQ